MKKTIICLFLLITMITITGCQKEDNNLKIDYQDYLLNHLDMYQLHIDNSNSNIEDISYQIVDFIKENNKVKK